jgi:hypothetical protein
VISRRGTQPCPFNNLRKKRIAARRFRRGWTRMSITSPSSAPPQILWPPLDLDEHLVQIPRVAHAAPAVPQPTSVVEPERQTPLPNGLVGHRDPAFGEQILDIAETQAKTKVEPHRVTKSYRTVERSGSSSA